MWDILFVQEKKLTKEEYDQIVNTPPEQVHEIQGMKLTTTDSQAGNSASASDIQVGGAHYKKCEIQPWDYTIANDLDYFQGSIIKYVTRWKDKGWIQDQYKARHFLDKYIETMEEKHKNLTDRPV